MKMRGQHRVSVWALLTTTTMLGVCVAYGCKSFDESSSPTTSPEPSSPEGGDAASQTASSTTSSSGSSSSSSGTTTSSTSTSSTSSSGDGSPNNCAARVAFTDDFERGGVATPSWDALSNPTANSNITLSIVNDITDRLQATVMEGATGGSFLAKGVDVGACPINVSFDIKVADASQLPATETGTLMSIHMKGASDNALSIGLDHVGLLLIETTSTGATTHPIQGLVFGVATTIALHFDPSSLVTTIIVGANTTNVTLQTTLGTPQTVELGVPAVDPQAGFQCSLDNVLIN